MSDDAAVLLSVRELSKEFKSGRAQGRRGHAVKAVDRVSLDVHRGETVAIVGESGSGKTTLSRLILRLIEPTSGAVELDGVDLLQMSARRLRRARRGLQMIFQDARGSLHPRRRIDDLLLEPLRIHGLLAGPERLARARELLEAVGLSEHFLSRYPSELSGGECQRVAIARALTLDPEILILDEPVSALDVSVQAQIINLLIDIQERTRVSFIFVSHDLALVRLIADTVYVMRKGVVVETGTVDEVFAAPKHPYTRELLAAALFTSTNASQVLPAQH